jgi:uncharacterized protein
MESRNTRGGGVAPLPAHLTDSTSGTSGPLRESPPSINEVAVPREPQRTFLENARSDPIPARKIQLLEVLVFIFLMFPSLATSFLALQKGKASFDLIAITTILRDLALVSLILFFLWRNHEPVIRIGWTLRAWTKEALVGVLLFVPLAIIAAFIESLLGSAGFTTESKAAQAALTPRGAPEFVLATVLISIVALAEETIFRGYLILRFEALTGNVVAAALLSAFVFSVGHGYEGAAGVVTVGVMGLVLAAVYLWRRSLVAPIVMHFLQDFLAMVVLPLLMQKH